MIINITFDTKEDNVNDFIGKLLSTNQSTIADNNSKPVKVKTIRKRRKILTDEERKEIKFLINSGENKTEIAQLYDVSYSTVCRI